MVRVPVAETEKHQSIVLRFVEGCPWEDTPLFQRIYAVRFASGDTVRGCESMAELVAHYNIRMDALFADMRTHGFRQMVGGRPTDPIPVYLADDNELVIGNQGNHRLAMAQVLHLDRVIVEIVGRHPASRPHWFEAPPKVGPDLPECARAIPAMTTEAERLCYYRLTKEHASRGAIVELGTWLGAATAYIAAGVRDAGAPVKVQAYDRFIWKPASHDAKAGGPINMSQLAAFQQNLGPLLEHVDIHEGEVTRLQWRGGDVALLVCDAPKRIPAISAVLTTFADALRPGSLMAWQDFAYFPSYDIPAALARLGDHLEFVEAVYPGTTAVFRLTSPWRPRAVSPDALALDKWTADEIEAAWDGIAARLPDAMRPRFLCGAAWFLCDRGAVDRARARFAALVAAHRDQVLPKWQYLLKDRPALMERYRPLTEAIAW